MPRPRFLHHSCRRPVVNYYKPRGVPLRMLKVVALQPEEFEALWLKDYRGLEQTQAAQHMRTSQSTFQRLLQVARKKISQALVEGRAIAIHNKNA